MSHNKHVFEFGQLFWIHEWSIILMRLLYVKISQIMLRECRLLFENKIKTSWKCTEPRKRLFLERDLRQSETRTNVFRPFFQHTFKKSFYYT